MRAWWLGQLGEYGGVGVDAGSCAPASGRPGWRGVGMCFQGGISVDAHRGFAASTPGGRGAE